MDMADNRRNDPSTDDSQPSQILQNALGGVDSVGKASDTTNDGSLGELFTTKNISSDSLHNSSRSSNSAPRYHYYGLASSQSQAQSHDDCPDNENSQKENFHAPGSSGEIRTGVASSVVPRPAAAHASSSSKVPNKEPMPHGGQPSHQAIGNKPKATPTMATTFQTPRATASSHHINPPPAQGNALPSRSIPPPPRLQTVEEFSQDSFAGPISQDPARDFIATAKEFEIPLSQLGFESQETGTSAPTGDPRRPSNMFVDPLRGRRVDRPPDVSPSLGKVLVAATPSHSGSSQSQPSQLSQQLDSQSLDQSIYSNRQPTDISFDDDHIGDIDARSQASTVYNSTPSSSYERLLRGEPEPADRAQPADDYQATQPSTQPEDFVGINNYMAIDAEGFGSDTRAVWGTGTDGYTATTTTDARHQVLPSAVLAVSTASSGAPRDVRSLVDPRKRWRINNRPVPAVAPALGSSSREAEGPDAMVETQPSNEGDAAELFPRSRHEVAWPTRKRQVEGSAGDDAMDVVPDSEPPQGDSQSIPTPASAPPQPVKVDDGLVSGIKKRNGRRISHEADTEEIVPDSVSVHEHEESEEDADEDVPLATKASKRASENAKAKAGHKAGQGRVPLAMVPLISPVKGNERAEVRDEVTQANQNQLNETVKSDVIRDPRKKPNPVAAKSKKASPPTRSWENDVVPSSVPDETRNTKPRTRRKAQEDKAHTVVPSDRKTRSRSIATSKSKKRRLSSATADSFEDHSDDDVRKMEKEEEEETELADDHYMDADFDSDEDEPGPSTRKRKRAKAKAKSKAIKPVSRASTKVAKRSESAPLERNTRALRSLAAASTSRMLNGQATRVFALWKQDGHFYPGTIHSFQGGTRYLVKFDDNTDDDVDILRMRVNGLRVGDNIIIIRTNEKATVVDDSRLHTEGIIGAQFHNGEELQRVDVGTAAIRIAARTISSQWADRMLDHDSIVTKVRQKPLKRTPSKLSLASTTSGRGRALVKTGIAITLSPKYDNQQGDREKLETLIQSNGGFVIGEWFSVIRMKGDYSHSNKRWVALGREIKWIGKSTLERIFLLADDPCSKPKYLIALALGIPCLSLNWLHDLLQMGEQDWQPYLLPQGTSQTLDARVSQFVDLDWCNSSDHLVEIMKNKVAPKLFEGSSVLLLGADFVPDPKSVSDPEMSQEAPAAVPRIILAMGASRVEAAVDVKYASADPSLFDYVISSDPTLEFGSDVNLVNVEWVKDSLISRQFANLPEMTTGGGKLKKGKSRG